MVDVKKLREKLGLNKKDFAEKMGVSVRTVEFWEQGSSTPSGSAEILLRMLDERGEMFSQFAKRETGDSANSEKSVLWPKSETEQFMSMLGKQQELISRHLDVITKRDEQIDRLIALLEER